MTTELPAREAARLEALRQYRILDTGREQSYDDLTSLAASICGVPIALISLVDDHRQWFKSKVGLDVSETPRDISFCAHAIRGKTTMVVDDVHGDQRFCNNPLVTGSPHIRFYAGVPLQTPSGDSIGTLCVIDAEPRQLSQQQLSSLEALARQVVIQLELRRVSAQLVDAMDKIKMMGNLIPICSYCKGVRNDKGYWQNVESFIKSYSNVEFSHGVCDRCMELHFPEVVEAEAGKAAESESRRSS